MHSITRVLHAFGTCSAVLLLAGCAIYSGTPERNFLSSVRLESPGWKDGELRGKVGQHFTARVVYQIGFTRTQEGPPNIEESYVTDPEYNLWGELPPGLSWSEATGTISGTPTTPGKWQIEPAVRDRVRGNNVYKGHGFWFTREVTSGGEVWTKVEKPIAIDISD